MTNISQKIAESISILIPFTRDYSAKLHASEIARILKIPQRTVSRKLDLLYKNGLVRFNNVGRNKYFYLDLEDSFSLISIIESIKEIKFSIEKKEVYLLIEEISKKYPVILFGSYAKGRAKEDSDLDLVIFGRNVQEIIDRYHFEVNPHYVNIAKFNKWFKEEKILAKEIVKDHVLFGEKEEIIKLFIRHMSKN